ncbi:hypothetical protein N7470_004051 [Penicillium chermesinum]|nr:hypothetical protein N7470_004051 [Penicillium chermesinum]
MASEPPQLDLQAKRAQDYHGATTTLAWVVLISSPILVALPPRRLDPLTVWNISTFAIAANYLTREKTGRSIVDRIETRISRAQGVYADLPSERARQIQEQMRAAREAQIRDGSVLGEELEKLKARQEQEKGGLKEEQKAIEEGKGYGDLISEYVWEVWNWGKKKDEEEDE